MTRFLYWRKMTWVIALAGALLLVWVISGGFSVAVIVLSVAVLCVLGVVWFMTRPLWRQGRGIRLRQLKYVDLPLRSPSTTPSASVS
jgi:hypothetical protein